MEEHELAWVVHWDLADFLRTGDPRHRLAGNSPILVDRYDGSVHAVSVPTFLGGDWVWLYVERIWGIPLRNVVAERVRQILSEDSSLAARRFLRREVPGLTPARAKEYIAAVRAGDEVPPDRSPQDSDAIKTVGGPATAG